MRTYETKWMEMYHINEHKYFLILSLVSFNLQADNCMLYENYTDPISCTFCFLFGIETLR